MQDNMPIWLTEKDLSEGKDMMEALESLDPTSKMAASIYIGALRDRQLLTEEKQQPA